LRIAWISYLDARRFSGGGERNQVSLIDTGRRRGHAIRESAFVGARPQRLLRRAGFEFGFRVDWDADLFILQNIRNAPHIKARIPDAVVDRALDSGRAVVVQDAWVDVCRFDLPCHGDTSRCPPACDRSFGNKLLEKARIAVFTSPRHHQLTADLLDVPLPEHVLYVRPMIDVDRFRPLSVERDLDVLYVGAINRAKGYYNLLERFGPDRLTLAGHSTLDEAVQGQWLGPVKQDDLPELYNRARIFAHLPEWQEPMGRTVVEAALCGCELVINDRVGATSYPRDEWTDPEVIRRHPDRFWDELEAAVDSL
jgi:glycosyltransferase involved in cell wall biosynthesis